VGEEWYVLRGGVSTTKKYKKCSRLKPQKGRSVVQCECRAPNRTLLRAGVKEKGVKGGVTGEWELGRPGSLGYGKGWGGGLYGKRGHRSVEKRNERMQHIRNSLGGTLEEGLGEWSCKRQEMFQGFSI